MPHNRHVLHRALRHRDRYLGRAVYVWSDLAGHWHFALSLRHAHCCHLLAVLGDVVVRV